MTPSMKTTIGSAVLSAGFMLTASTAVAQDMYISGNLGLNFQDDSFNEGLFLSDFTTGEVTGVSPPLTIAIPAAVNWNTDYDDDIFYRLALGWDIDIIRMELEYSRSEPDVDSHTGVIAGDIDLSAIDAGVLISGNSGDLGVSVADLVANGQGSMKTSAVMMNFMYDFDLDLPFTPYAGVGLGMARTNIDFQPSGVSIISDKDTSFVYQFILGASYAINEQFEVEANYRYRDASEPDFISSLLDARFNIENKSSTLDVGLRVRF